MFHIDSIEESRPAETTGEIHDVAPEIQGLLDLYSNSANQVNHSDFPNLAAKTEDGLSVNYETSEFVTLYAASNEENRGQQTVEIVKPTEIGSSGHKAVRLVTDRNSGQPSFPVARTEAETSLNSSGYSSANSPPDSEAGWAEEAGSPTGALAGLNSSLADWVSRQYPVLYRVWQQTSASQFFQGGVELLCSLCRLQPARGFHDELPICEADRVNKPCAVCRIRSASGFSYGLALCEADKVFLFRLFSHRTRYPACTARCPVRVRQWCGYCRLAACLATRGFRFNLQQQEANMGTRQLSQVQDSDSGPRKRKLSGEAVCQPGQPSQPGQSSAVVGGQEMLAGLTSAEAAGPELSITRAHPALMEALSQPIAKTVGEGSGVPLEGPLVRAGQGVEAGDLSQPARPAEPVYYDGSLLGSGGVRPGGAAGLLVHPATQTWVRLQQEKYLRYHIRLYHTRQSPETQ